MRFSILVLLAGTITALASPALRISVSVDEGVGAEYSSQSALTIDDPRNFYSNFILKVPDQDLVVSPQYTAPGQGLVLSPQTGSSSEVFTLRGGKLFTANTNGGPPLVAFTTTRGGPPVLVLGFPDGGDNLRPLAVGAFSSDNGDGTLVLKQFDPANGGPPKSFAALNGAETRSEIALGGGPPITLQIQRVGDY